jgi:hypothetical protein
MAWRFENRTVVDCNSSSIFKKVIHVLILGALTLSFRSLVTDYNN